MAYTIAVLSQKGGTGKTTVVRTLSDAFRRRGVRTLALDLDPQGNLSDYFDLPPDVQPTIAEVLLGRASVEQATHDDMVPANLSLAEAESAERAVSILDHRPDLGADYLALADEVLARVPPLEEAPPTPTVGVAGPAPVARIVTEVSAPAAAAGTAQVAGPADALRAPTEAAPAPQSPAPAAATQAPAHAATAPAPAEATPAAQAPAPTAATPAPQVPAPSGPAASAPQPPGASAPAAA